MQSSVESWSTQQLAEFVAVVASFGDERSAIQGALECTAEALEVEVAALVRKGEIEASIGFAAGKVDGDALLAATGGASEIEIEGLGACDALAISLEDSRERHMVVARFGGGYSQEERDLLRGMARVLTLTLRMLRSLEEERALRGRAEQEIAERKRIQKEADRLREEFFASLSHELRTPLTSILGYTDMLLAGIAGELSEQQREFLQITDRNARRELRLVNDLLFASMSGAGKFKIDRSKVDLPVLVHEAIGASEPMADKKEIQVTDELTIVQELNGDRDRLAQLLDNLISNAIKFTPTGGEVEVRVTGDQDRVRLEVWNSGSFISAEEQGRLFDRFYRTPSAEEQVIPGVGLGLAISKAIAEAHNGTIGVRSELGEGTAFFVDLPLDNGRAEAKPRPASRAA